MLLPCQGMRFQTSGVWTAIVTPFTEDGAVDEAGLRQLVDYQIAQGVTGLVPCGTTGESPTLDHAEHARVVERVIGWADGRCGVLAGAGSNSTATALAHVRAAEAAGATAALVVDCYYNGPSSLELRERYYERLLEVGGDLPLVPYVIPGRTGCALGPEDLAMLHLGHPTRVPAVKQATGDLDRMRRDRALAGPGLAILSGDDDLTSAMMRDPGIGASGVVSVMANLVPRAVVELVRAEAAGADATADAKLATLRPLFKVVGVLGRSVRRLPDGRAVEVEDRFKNPTPVKTMMRGLGMLRGGCRPPLGTMTPDAVATVRRALEAVHEADPSVLAPIGEAYGVDVVQRLRDDACWLS